MYILYICALMLCTSCTVAMTMVHTEGTATDVVDEAQSPQNDIKPDLNISGLPGL